MAFGIPVARFRVLYGSINTEPERVDSIVKACTVLHNFICDEMSTYLLMLEGLIASPED